METNLNTPGEELITQPPEKGGKRTVIVIVSLLFVALLAGSAYAYTVLDFLKSPRQIYLEAETKGLNDFAKSVGEVYEEYHNKNIKPYLENTVHSKFEISGEATGIVPPDPTAVIIMDVLKKSKLIVDTSLDEQNQQSYTKLDVAVEGNNLLGVEYFVDKNKIALGVPVIYNKYGFADLKDRDKIQTRFGLQTLPKRLVRYNEFVDALKISKQDADVILNGYGKLYADSLDDRQVTSRKATFAEGDTKISARELTVTFSEGQFKELLKKFAAKMQNDEKLIDLIYTKQKAWIKLMEDSGNNPAAQGIKEMTKGEIKTSLNQFNKNLDDSLKEMKMLEGAKMVLLVDAKDNILDRKISFTESGSKVLIRTAGWTGQDKTTNGVFVFKSEEPNQVEEFKIDYTAKPENDQTTKGTLTVDAKETSAGKQKQLIQFITGFTVTKEGSKQQAEMMFSGKFEQETPEKFSGTIKTTITDNDKNKTRETDTGVEIKFAQTAEESISGPGLKLAIKGKEEFGAKLTLPKLDANNSVDLANATDEEIMKMQQDIQAGLQAFLVKNQALFQPFMQ